MSPLHDGCDAELGNDGAAPLIQRQTKVVGTPARWGLLKPDGDRAAEPGRVTKHRSRARDEDNRVVVEVDCGNKTAIRRRRQRSHEPAAGRDGTLATLRDEAVAAAARRTSTQAREETKAESPGPACRDGSAKKKGRKGAGDGRPGGRRAKVGGMLTAAEESGESHDGADRSEGVVQKGVIRPPRGAKRPQPA